MDKVPNIDSNQEQLNFRSELGRLINKYSLESASNTPDFILAGFLSRALDNFDQTMIERKAYSGNSNDSGSDSRTA